MTVRFLQPDKYGFYFVTFTCFNWLKLIELTNSYDLVYDWFDFLKNEGSYITGYVIMPNHVHAIVAFRNHDQSINTRVGEGKRFIAYGLVKRLKNTVSAPILEILQQGVNETDQKKGKLHQVFEPSFDCKECRSDEFIWQKLNYMHGNPCSGKWQLVENTMDYIHSSARYYETGIQGFYPVTNLLEMNKIDLGMKCVK